MPVPANNIPVHHWSLLKADLSRRLGGMGCRRIVNVRKPDLFATVPKPSRRINAHGPSTFPDCSIRKEVPPAGCAAVTQRVSGLVCSHVNYRARAPCAMPSAFEARTSQGRPLEAEALAWSRCSAPRRSMYYCRSRSHTPCGSPGRRVLVNHMPYV
jgi:hypothetical protein